MAAVAHHHATIAVAATTITTAVATTAVAVAAKLPSKKPLIERKPLYKGIFLFTAQSLNGTQF